MSSSASDPSSDYLPSFTILMVSQTLQDYHALRASLIEEDYSLRRDRSSPLDSDLRDLEKQADEIIRRIRHIEAIQVWTSDYESVPHPFPGMEFLTGEQKYRDY